MMLLEENGVKVITGCPELDIKEIAQLFLNKTLELGENSCGSDPNHTCHSHHEEGHHNCGGHHH